MARRTQSRLRRLLSEPSGADRRRKGDGRHNPPGALLIVDAGRVLDADDEALAAIAIAIGSAVRADDVVGRIGASTFGLFLTGADEADMEIVAERVDASVRSILYLPSQSSGAVSISAGGILLADHAGFSDMFREAEAGLFGGDAGDSSMLDFALGAIRIPLAARH